MQSKKKSRLPIILAVVAVGMFGFAFALIPMYTLLCKTGVNGKTNTETVAASTDVDYTRTITVQFVSTNNAYLAWDFYPAVTSIKLHPGENKLIHYYAKNNAGVGMTIQAIPSVTPGVAAKYVKKTECFCFTQQYFAKDESRDMPVLFHVDTDLPKEISTLTLSYTLFNADKFRKSTKPNTAAGHL